MIQSKQYQAPKSDDASGMRDINNVIVDSGYRFGQQVYQLILRQEGNATPDNIDLDTYSNGLTVKVGSSTISTSFSTDTATTIAAFATAIASNANIESAVVVGHTINIKVVENTEVALTDSGVTGATIRTSLTVKLIADLRIVPAIVTIDNEPEALRIDTNNPSGTSYIGYADLGTANADAGWRIKKTVVAGTVTTITYADGNKLFDNVWDNRTSLSYS